MSLIGKPQWINKAKYKRWFWDAVLLAVVAAIGYMIRFLQDYWPW